MVSLLIEQGSKIVHGNPIPGHSADESVIMWAQTLFATQAQWSDLATKGDNLSQIQM